MAEVIYRPVVCGFTGKYGILAGDAERQVYAVACPFTDDKDRIDRLIERLEREKTALADFEDAFLHGDFT